MNVFELFATLGLDTSSYDKGLDGAEKKGSSFASKLRTGLGVAAGVATAAVATTTAAVVGGTKAFTDAAKQTAAYGDNVDKASQKVGFSAKSFQEWDYVLNLAGTSMQGAQMGIKTMTNQLDAARKGNKEAVAQFKALGVSINDIKTLSREELFEKTIAGFQRMEEGTKRAALANKVFGRSGQEMTALFNMTNEQTQQAIKTANEYGMVLSDKGVKASANFTDSMTTLSNTMTGLKNNMMAEFLPSLTSITDGLAGIFSGTNTEEGTAKIWYGISTLADKMTAEAPKLFEIGGTILSALASSLTANLPALTKAAVPVIMELATSLINQAPALISAAAGIISTITGALTENLGTILTAAQQIVLSLAQSISQNAGNIIPSIVQIILTIVTTLTNPEFTTPLLQAGLQIITGLLNGILTSLPLIIEQLPVIIQNISQSLLEGLPLILDAGIQIFMALVDALPTIIEALGTALPSLIDTAVGLIIKGTPLLLQGAVQLFMAIIQALPTIIKALVQNLPTIITTTVNTLISHLPELIKGAVQLFMGIVKAIPQIIIELGKQMPTIIQTIIKGLNDGIGQVTQVGVNLIKGLWNGISNMSKWIGEKIKGFGKGVLNGLKSFFGIHSPSTVFRDEIGQMLALGLGEGFETGMDKTMSGMEKTAQSTAQSVADALTAPINSLNAGGKFSVTASGTGTTSATGAKSGSVINATFNIYAREGQDIRELAKQVSTELQNLINDKEKIYA